MPGEMPFWIRGKIVEVSAQYFLAYAKVSNGNVYHIHSNTPGIKFSEIKKGQEVYLEVTNMLTRVLSANIIKE